MTKSNLGTDSNFKKDSIEDMKDMVLDVKPAVTESLRAIGHDSLTNGHKSHDIPH
eukprot:CAMPEP_0116880338 /NCGR_PEP_ID=MMETSP0463-20121206/12244_1 /TAXON_ID=181622 /ORGANISM="Strombidinopsis sp, Strain SopsisLIS2011" /LENGTH=54 /DNA_ID=CAMNT_0004530771 /DNA_START=621 /DNA_END=785 /DNA_ORIENTATION=+